jgi:hypothetical protein
VLRRSFENRDVLQHCVSDDLLLAVEISSGEAIPCSITLQSQVADFIGLCNGSQTLQENADRFAAGLNADPAIIRRECCLLIRQLAERNLIGFTPKPSDDPVPAQTEA